MYRIAILLGLLLVGWQTFAYGADTKLPQHILDNGFEDVRIVLFESDIELQRILASGRPETRADWSENGQGYADKWIQQFFQDNGLDFTKLEIPDDEAGDRIRQIVALHRMVGFSIMNHEITPLPTKKGGFDWTIGSGASEIADASDADYGLFVFYRRGYTTAGRVGIAILGAIAGVAVPATYQVGFTTLVDLKTGDLVWFSKTNHAKGDLRDEESSQYTIISLLSEFPGLVLPELPKTVDNRGLEPE